MVGNHQKEVCHQYELKVESKDPVSPQYTQGFRSMYKYV